MGLVLTPTEVSSGEPVTEETEPPPGLVETRPPQAHGRDGRRTADFRARKSPDRSVQDARNRQLGLAGELAVVAHEQRRLRAASREDLAEQVRHVALVEGDGAGYDVKSFEPDGSEKFIEVKTTKGGEATDFLISANEVEFSTRHASRYYLYRLYEFDAASGRGRFYVRHGGLGKELSIELSPVLFRARVTSPTPKPDDVASTCL